LSHAGGRTGARRIGTQRLTDNTRCFWRRRKGYFKAEGIDLAMTAYRPIKVRRKTLAAGATDFGLAGFTPTDQRGRHGLIKAIGAGARSATMKDEIVASMWGSTGPA
jgi:ABC-type nitrate/sulfonate/bicarbonate transport system substrate-binding protein